MNVTGSMKVMSTGGNNKEDGAGSMRLTQDNMNKNMNQTTQEIKVAQQDAPA